MVSDLEDLDLDTDRIAGASRLETATAIAAAYSDAATTAVLARAFSSAGSADPTQAFADTLAGGGLAVQLGAPVLLTETDRLSEPTAAWLEQSAVEQVIVLGGPGAVSVNVVAALKGMGLDVNRVSGDERFATAVAIAADGRGLPDAGAAAGILLLEGQVGDAWADAFPAALRSGRDTAPIVLANGDTLPGATQGYLVPAPVVLTCGALTSPGACDAAARLLVVA